MNPQGGQCESENSVSQIHKSQEISHQKSKENTMTVGRISILTEDGTLEFNQAANARNWNRAKKLAAVLAYRRNVVIYVNDLSVVDEPIGTAVRPGAYRVTAADLVKI
jgi:hypothetical protein